MMVATEEDKKKPVRNKFQQHINALIWKSYTQRQRRWRLLLFETVIAAMLFLVAIFIAKPVFLTPLQDEPEPPLTSADILVSLHNSTVVGYTPDVEPYATVMARAAELLQTNIMAAETLEELHVQLYSSSKEANMSNKVIWVVFQSEKANSWSVSIRSTDVARLTSEASSGGFRNMHLRAGFLAVQLAVSTAIVEHSSGASLQYELDLASMPVTPLMERHAVLRVISQLLLCYTLALLPPVMETEAMVVTESMNHFKRALRMRAVNASTIYLGWLLYAFLSALPACLLGSVSLILIFRWIHPVYALLMLVVYVNVMMMLALIMAMYHDRALIACVWSTLGTLMQTFIAELMVHHQYDSSNGVIRFLLDMLIPPLGLVRGLNEFALLQTGRGDTMGLGSLVYTIGSWVVMILVYFQLLMLLQRTIGRGRAIGGQVSWKDIIFKQAEDAIKLRHIVKPTGKERDKLQEVDELVAKAISFRNVSKSIMGIPMITNVTLDIYRNEFTSLHAERIQDKMMNTIEDLLIGLTYADEGTINILGTELKLGTNCMTDPLMMGYCHYSKALVDDLTVEEHMNWFTEICLWKELPEYVFEYTHMRVTSLLVECDLVGVRGVLVRDLGIYYRAQLCWALAMLLEPRIIIIPYFADHPSYVAVVKDKIVKYKKSLTIVKISYTSINIEYADRVFLFDNNILSFGGSPAYMFFKFGREYRVRVTFRSGTTRDDERTVQLLSRALEAGATVRAHLGTLLILKLPASPTESVAALVKYLGENAGKYGITSMNITLPDSEEICHRAMSESRSETATLDTHAPELSSKALQRISEHKQRKLKSYGCFTPLGSIGWKYISFYMHYKLALLVTIVSAISTGVILGLTLSDLLLTLDEGHDVNRTLHGEVLTVEALEQETVLVLRVDNANQSRSLAYAYALSQTNATKKEIEKMEYTALIRPESLTEYLVTRAIDSPQQYVYKYAYGMDVATDPLGNFIIQALYSPLHKDHAAAARSLARVYMALLRHYSGQLDASLQITDDPLTLQQTPGMDKASTPPLFIQFLLVLSISHLTLIPSHEHGLIRYMQTHSLNFSPACYWLTLYIWDLVLYCVSVGLISLATGGVMYLTVPRKHFYFSDLMVIPFMMMVYGLGCVPQAFLFALGPRPALNSMAFIIFNLVFGEATILAKLFYGNLYDNAMNFMVLSPLYNMASALLKIKQIFLYNSECIIFKSKQLCASKIFHKCCKKCGVLQKCFEKQYYMSRTRGILMEVLATISTAVIYMALLFLWEYRVIQRLWNIVMSLIHSHELQLEEEVVEFTREKSEVLDKMMQLQTKKNHHKVDTFGEYLLAANVSKKARGVYTVRNVYLGLGKGEALALSGLKRHGRLILCKMLAGYKLPSEGTVWSMSKWKLNTNPYMFGRQISLCCELDPVPRWMTVYDALELIGALRGVPSQHLKTEIQDYIEALELTDRSATLVRKLLPSERKRLHFAAAVVGAPPVVVVDECTAYQEYSVRSAMYFILHQLRRRGHAVFISSNSVESHMPVTNRLAIILDGQLYDIDTVENLLERYGNKGYTVVVHLKDEVSVDDMFGRYFQDYTINDTSEVLVNVQVLDNLDWVQIFEKMEQLKAENYRVYSYIVTAVPIDYIYNNILAKERGLKEAPDILSWPKLKRLLAHKPKRTPSRETVQNLKRFEKKYGITTLCELPWSVIF